VIDFVHFTQKRWFLQAVQKESKTFTSKFFIFPKNLKILVSSRHHTCRLLLNLASIWRSCSKKQLFPNTFWDACYFYTKFFPTLESYFPESEIVWTPATILHSHHLLCLCIWLLYILY